MNRIGRGYNGYCSELRMGNGFMIKEGSSVKATGRIAQIPVSKLVVLEMLWLGSIESR